MINLHDLPREKSLRPNLSVDAIKGIIAFQKNRPMFNIRVSTSSGYIEIQGKTALGSRASWFGMPVDGWTREYNDRMEYPEYPKEIDWSTIEVIP